MTIVKQSLSNAEARRIALSAQGFSDPRPTGRVDRRHFRKVLSQIGLLQIDSVNVLVRSQELPLFARLGPHPRTLIEDATRDGELYEYFVHEASLVPTSQFHLHRWRMRDWYPWPQFRREVQRIGSYVEHVYQRVVDEGPMVAGDLKARVGKKGTWWDLDDGKIALESLFYSGRLSAQRRPQDFARVYDLPERMLPAEVLARPALPEYEAHKELLVLAAQYHGVGTLKDLADYHRLSPTKCKVALGELVEEGRILQCNVNEWEQAAYVHPNAQLRRHVNARALLSPFDPVVWNRERALRIFDFHYRISIYTPVAQRQHGYYVLPFLLGDELVGRVDLKADRGNRTLLVQSAWAEPGVNKKLVAAEMVEEFRVIASWLELDRIEATGAGTLGEDVRRLTRRPNAVK